MRTVKRLLTICLLVLAVETYSQPGPNIPPDPPSAVPVTGVEWLLIAGGLLGVRKVYKNFRHR